MAFMWYDAFFLFVLATSAIIVAINWEKYHMCAYPLHQWTVVDYTAVFVFRLLMFIDNALAAGMGLDSGAQLRHACFCGRVIVLSILGLLLYPFLFAWTIIGTLWFSSAKRCLPNNGQKMCFVIWLIFSYCGLLGMSLICLAKWFVRRQGNRFLGIGGSIDLTRVPDWAFEATDQEMDLQTYPAQREAVEAHIQQLPKLELEAVPTDCDECLICLEEFQIGNEVRGLPCAHDFHVECIDKWLRLNVRCPRCRCNVFPNLNLSPIIEADRVATQRYLMRLHSVIRHVRPGQAPSGRDVDTVEMRNVEPVQVVVDGSTN